MTYLFVSVLSKRAAQGLSKNKNAISAQEVSLLISVIVLILLASGLAYRGHSLARFISEFRDAD